MRVVFKAPGQVPEIRKVGDDLKAKQQLVGERFDCCTYGPDDEFDLWFNDEYEELELNLHYQAEAIICGPIFVCKVGGKVRSVGLTESECNIVIALLKRDTPG